MEPGSPTTEAAAVAGCGETNSWPANVAQARWPYPQERYPSRRLYEDFRRADKPEEFVRRERVETDARHPRLTTPRAPPAQAMPAKAEGSKAAVERNKRTCPRRPAGRQDSGPRLLAGEPLGVVRAVPAKAR